MCRYRFLESRLSRRYFTEQRLDPPGNGLGNSVPRERKKEKKKKERTPITYRHDTDYDAKHSFLGRERLSSPRSNDSAVETIENRLSLLEIYGKTELTFLKLVNDIL